MRKVVVGGLVGLASVLLFGGNIFAATISGNGSGSHNSYYQYSFNYSSVDQTNVANVGNHVNVGKKNPKGTQANFNTNSSVDVTGGSVTNSVGINNVANNNSLDGGFNCCLCGQLGNVTISGNGDHSSNLVVDTSKCVTKVDQTNMANIINNVLVGGGTGQNSADHNTGSAITVTGGDSTTTVTVNNVVNTNTIQ